MCAAEKLFNNHFDISRAVSPELQSSNQFNDVPNDINALNVPNDINALNHNDNLSAVTLSSNNIYLSDATNPNSSVASFKLCESTPANLNLYSESSQGHDNSHASQAPWNLFSDLKGQEMTMKSTMFSNSTMRPKADKYKFPAIDPPALKGLIEYTPKELYIYIINLMYHRLTPETYKLWCELTEREWCFAD